MSNIDNRLKKLEEKSNSGGVVYPVTSPGSNGFWYVGSRRFSTLEEVKAAYPGRRVKPVTLPVKMDLADL
jgi:hypothetical protein